MEGSSLSTKMYELAKKAAHDAVKYDSEGEWELAVNHYLQAYDILISLVKYTDSKRMKDLYAQRAEEYLNRSYELKQQKGARRAPAGSKSAPDDLDDEMSSAILSTIVPEKPNVRWADIAGLASAKQAIEDSIILPLRHPEIFEGMPSWKGVLLFGPPGCGKTLIAKAAATECESTFFSVSAADLMVKWVGDSEQRIKTLFQLARKMQPSIIFLDEVDALGVKRDGGESAVSTRVLTQMLQGMDGITSKVDDRIMVLGATNRPWNLDTALLRRFDKRIMVPLPDEETRTEIFRISIKNLPRLQLEGDIDMYELSKLTEGYTGDDIKKLCMDAWYIPIHELKRQGALDTNSPRLVTLLDFQQALRSRKSSVSPEENRQNDVWAKQVGAL
jgi:vacuolar protein-sorting-associated protein 4